MTRAQWVAAGAATAMLLLLAPVVWHLQGRANLRADLYRYGDHPSYRCTLEGRRLYVDSAGQRFRFTGGEWRAGGSASAAYAAAYTVCDPLFPP